MSEEMEPLKWLEKIQQRAKELRSEEAAVKEQIRSGFVKQAIVFMDIIGSTEFKQRYTETPEVWILRVRQFSELLSAAVGNAGGKVVKYIGDEVMAVFDNEYDAQNLVGRIMEIEKNLTEATGYETRIKVTADYGYVYFLEFPGHDQPDPQGPAVDRCARIAKFGQSGQVLASADFATKTASLGWHKVGLTDLKGLGSQVIYQLGRVSVDLAPKVTIKEEEFKALQENLQESRFAVEELKAKNERLAEELRATGRQPGPGELAGDTNDAKTKWDAITRLIDQLRDLITRSPVPGFQYARFLFLWISEKPGERYNTFEGKVFDESIESGLVVMDFDEYYKIDDSHPRNARAIKLMQEIEYALQDYLSTYGQDPEDLYRWTLSDPEFWANKIEIYVIQSQ